MDGVECIASNVSRDTGTVNAVSGEGWRVPLHSTHMKIWGGIAGCAPGLVR